MPDILFILMRYFIRKSPFFHHYLRSSVSADFRMDAVTSHKKQHREAGVVGGEKIADLHKIFIAVCDTHFYVHKI